MIATSSVDGREAELGLTIIMPAHNEEQRVAAAVERCLATLGTLSIAGEVLVVDDGSGDRTAEIVSDIAAAAPRVRLVRHARRRGVGQAFWTGVENARGGAVCTIPGDNENDPIEILRYFWLLDHVDFVVPFIFNQREVRSPARNVTSALFRAIVNGTFRVSFNYTNGTVLYRRSPLLQLPSRDTTFFFQADALVRLARSGYLFAEVPSRLDRRQGGVSKALSRRSLAEVARSYLRLVADTYLRRGSSRPAWTSDSRAAARCTAQPHSRNGINARRRDG